MHNQDKPVDEINKETAVAPPDPHLDHTSGLTTLNDYGIDPLLRRLKKHHVLEKSTDAEPIPNKAHRPRSAAEGSTKPQVS